MSKGLECPAESTLGAEQDSTWDLCGQGQVRTWTLHPLGAKRRVPLGVMGLFISGLGLLKSSLHPTRGTQMSWLLEEDSQGLVTQWP